MSGSRLTPEEIWEMDGGCVCLGSDEVRIEVCNALAFVPEDIVEDVMDNCLFLGDGGMTARVLVPKVHDGKTVVWIGSPWWDLYAAERTRTLLHEVAHYVLGHNQAEGLIEGELQGTAEADADALADLWLRGPHGE